MESLRWRNWSAPWKTAWSKRAALACLAAVLYAQAPNEQNTPPHPPRPPDFAGVRYGPHVRNDLDIYLAESDKPAPLVLYFFPGGFVVGNKNTVPVALLDAAKAAGVTVAACNYRYATDSPLPASFHDAARALQFLRLHPRNIKSTRARSLPQARRRAPIFPSGWRSTTIWRSLRAPIPSCASPPGSAPQERWRRRLRSTRA